MTRQNIMLRRSTLGSLLTGILILFSYFAFAESTSMTPDPSFQSEVEKIVEQYIRSHPEVIEHALQVLQTNREAEERERVRKVIATRQEELLDDPQSPVSGNPKGDVTVVEFFDYRCGYCKRVAGAVSQLQQDDPNVRIVYKDFPILGETSELASRAALASKSQGKHLIFHEALLASKNELTQETILTIAAEAGLNTERLHKDMHSPAIQEIIESNRALARELGINGTPGFIVGTELIPGAVNVNDLKRLVRQARQEKS